MLQQVSTRPTLHIKRYCIWVKGWTRTSNLMTFATDTSILCYLLLLPHISRMCRLLFANNAEPLYSSPLKQGSLWQSVLEHKTTHKWKKFFAVGFSCLHHHTTTLPPNLSNLFYRFLKNFIEYPFFENFDKFWGVISTFPCVLLYPLTPYHKNLEMSSKITNIKKVCT